VTDSFSSLDAFDRRRDPEALEVAPGNRTHADAGGGAARA
jgi:hypothetical protein